MPWLQNLVGRLRDSHLLEIANEIVAHKKVMVWDRVGQRAAAMQPAEARGYIHARVSGIVRSEVDRACSQNRWLKPTLRSRLIEIVQSELVDQAMVELRLHRHAAAVVRKAA